MFSFGPTRTSRSIVCRDDQRLQPCAAATATRQWLRKSSFWPTRTRPGFPNVLLTGASAFGHLELSKTVNICVIDGDDLVREAIESLIQSLGYEVETFASAAEYLASNRAHNYSCIIADVQMPDMAGIDLQKRLIGTGNPTPIIFMGAHSTEALARHAAEAGAVGFLRKPLKAESLIEYLAKALKSKSDER
jgi:CheY-like chemotaxis protein